MSLSVMRRSVAWVIVAAAAWYGISSWQLRGLPRPEALRLELAHAPEQGPTDRAPFEFEYKDKSCEVRPVARYELWGLVVSANDIHSFADIYHDSTSVDTRDLCVLWGRNVETDDYTRVEFWSGPFTCYYRFGPGERVDGTAIANNHLITDRPEIREALRDVHRGDQVHLRGMLVDYRMDDWGEFWRRTSKVRDDAGCEVVFLDELDVLQRHRPSWHASRSFARATLVISPVLWLGLVVWEARSGRSRFGEL